MPSATRLFTAFTEADLTTGNLDHGTVFALPHVATVSFSVADNDDMLSGDVFDYSLDRSGQQAEIIAGDADLSNGHRIYAERTFEVTDEDGNSYTLLEVEQEGNHTDFFTFVGTVPPSGAVLTVGRAHDVLRVDYDDLGAGDLTQNIVTIAAKSDDFNLLVMALGAANLVETVQGLNDVTVFAPTDAAFTQLAVDLGFDGDTSDEDAVFGAIVAALTELAEDGNPIPLLTNVLLYHVSGSVLTADEIAAAETVDTLAGAPITPDGSELGDLEPDIDNPNIVIPDIEATNGIIQAIDRVLLPLDIPGNTPEPESEPAPTLTDLVEASGGDFDYNPEDLDLLLNALQITGLDAALDAPDGDFTVFAPDDAAFVSLSQTLGFEGSDEGGAFAYLVDALTLLSGGADPVPLLSTILQYHVAPESLGSTEVLASDSIETLIGASLGVDGASLVDADPDVPNPNIIALDIGASNGVAHIIDGVLLPVDVLPSNGANDVDFIIDDDGRSFIRTGADNDLVSGKGGNDRIFLGSGDDIGIGGTGKDRLSGGLGNDSLNGEEGHDRLFGGKGNDMLNGEEGRDLLVGGNGDDMLDGGLGRDRLVGGKGEDMLTGGSHADIFVFARHFGEDTVTDFTIGQDLIALRYLRNFDDVDGHISDTTDGALIEVGKNSITLQGVMANELSADDFLF